MRIFLAVVLLCRLLLGCVASKEKYNKSGSMSLLGEPSAVAKALLERCRFFGTDRALLDCVLKPSDGRNVQGVFDVGILKDGENALPRIFNDRRLSGEKVYIIEFDMLREARHSPASVMRGLLGQLTGRVYRGEPTKGGTLLLNDVSIRIERELHWGWSQGTREAALFFALDEGSRLWAVPLGSDSTSWSRIMELRIRDRLRTADLELLRRGAIVHIELGPDAAQVRFRFQSDIGHNTSTHPQGTQYTAEIIEE